MVLELTDFAAPDTNYVQKLNANNAAIESAVNSLAAQISATSGDGAVLLQDLFDRPGIVGSSSYRLDLDAYDGGTSITIGRRPAFDAAKGESDVSILWGLFGGEWQRVSQTGDLVLNAATIISGLPKTIYVGVPSTGIAQLYEDAVVANVVMLYSMCWDGFSLACFTRLAHLLPGYSLLQQMAGAPKMNQVFDTETDWRDGDLYGKTQIVFPGAADDNEIGLDGAVEILGFFCSAARDDDDGFSAPTGDDPDAVAVRFQVVDETETVWTDADFDFDASNIPDTNFRGLASGIDEDRFVTEVKEFRLKLVSVGANVVSARCFSWGVYYRPLLGAPIPKDDTKVDLT